MKNGVVLNGSGDDVFSFADVGKGNSLQCPVVRLGTACGEVDLIWLCVDGGCNLCTRFVNRSLVLLADTVHRRRVAELLGKVRKHRLHHLRGRIRCCGVIHIHNFFLRTGHLGKYSRCEQI